MSLKQLDITLDSGVAVVKFSREIINALDLELVRELSQYLNGAKGDERTSGLVLTSANEKFFSIGFDIPDLIGLERDDFMEFYRAFNRLCIDLYTFPKPTVAAITGHAVAGGCIIAICCDYRIIAEGKKLMGLNEIKLGVPLPYPADCILRQITDDRSVRRLVDTGDFFPPEETLRMGLVDEVMPVGDVLPASVEKVKAIASSSLRAYEVIKRYRTEKVVQQIHKGLVESEVEFVEMWYSDEVRHALKIAAEKF